MQSNFSLARSVRSRNLSARASSFFCATLALALLLAPANSLSAAPSGRINHVVIFWLKRPGNAEDRARLARASENFRHLPGVLRVEVGHGLPVRRPGIEQSFDLCAVFTFRNQAALDRFATDPRHLSAVETVLKPLVRRYIVFDAAVD